MEFTGTFRMEPEEFGRFIAAIPKEVRQQFIDSAIKAYPMMFNEFMKVTGTTMPAFQSQFNLFDPFGLMKLLPGGSK